MSSQHGIKHTNTHILNFLKLAPPLPLALLSDFLLLISSTRPPHTDIDIRCPSRTHTDTHTHAHTRSGTERSCVPGEEDWEPVSLWASPRPEIRDPGSLESDRVSLFCPGPNFYSSLMIRASIDRFSSGSISSLSVRWFLSLLLLLYFSRATKSDSTCNTRTVLQ